MAEKFSSNKLKQALGIFREYSKDPRFLEDTNEREDRKNFFRKLKKEQFDELTIGEVIKKLWASRIWGNQDYLVNQIIKKNGIDNLSIKFKALFSGQGTPGQKYEEFSDIKGIGPSMLSEIICHLDPKNGGIWNDKARKALIWLEAKGIPVEKYHISGKEYDDFNNFLKELARILTEDSYKDVDLLFVDYFLWEIVNRFKVEAESKAEKVGHQPVKEASRHDELRDKLAEIGSWLGFEATTEVLIATGAKVDVIWRARIANLGAVSYVFEVQDRGSIDSLIVNLQKAQKNPTVQKLVVVSDKEQIEKIKSEIHDMPEIFRNAATFWDAVDVDTTHQSLDQVSSSIDKLGLINKDFER